jgi:hypothetical protein
MSPPVSDPTEVVALAQSWRRWPIGLDELERIAKRLRVQSGVNPARIHVTLPTTVRLRRTVPKMLVIHHADLEPNDVETVEGVPVTTPVRTIRDAHASQPSAGVPGRYAQAYALY